MNHLNTEFSSWWRSKLERCPKYEKFNMLAAGLNMERAWRRNVDASRNKVVPDSHPGNGEFRPTATAALSTT